MDLRLDVYVKRKTADTGFSLDKRKYRQIRNNQERLIEKLKLDLELAGITSNKDAIISDFLKIKNFDTINFPLMIIVYDYFSKKLFDIDNVALDFNNDFNRIIKDIKEKGTFNLDRKGIIYSFRQDFIIYLLILYRDLDSDYNYEMDDELDDDIDEEYMNNKGEDINYEIPESIRETEENIEDEYFSEII